MNQTVFYWIQPGTVTAPSASSLLFHQCFFFLVQTDKHADVGTETAALKLQPFYYYEQQVFTCSGAQPTLSAHVTLAGVNNRLRLTQTLINQRSYDEPEERQAEQNPSLGGGGNWHCPSLCIDTNGASSVQSVSANSPDALRMNLFITGAVGEEDHTRQGVIFPFFLKKKKEIQRK